MKQTPTDMIDLVLIGGGHAQIAVLKSFGMNPISGVRLTLVTDVMMAPYSGMLPGYVEGHHSLEDMHIDLLKLARFAGARLVKRAVKDIDFVKQNIMLGDGLNLYYDVLSLNCGAVPAAEAIMGTDAHAITVKPISHFLEKMPAPAELRGDIAVIGGGAAGCELALSLQRHYRHANTLPACHIFSRSARLLPTAPMQASVHMQDALTRNQITVHQNIAVREVTRDHVVTQDGQKTPAAHIFVVTAARPAGWISKLAVSHCEAGYIQVRPTLQTIEYDNVFAAGDVASMIGKAREKAGVFAVRAGPYLAANLRAFIEQRALKNFHPQSRYLALIGLGGKQALAIRGSFVAKGAFWWHLKNWIDRRFMRKFTQLPEMQIADAPLPALAHTLGIPHAPEPFECAGCGAKAGADVLLDAVQEASAIAAEKGVNPRYLPPSGIAQDYGSIPLPNKGADITSFSQSVDFLSQFISDSYLFGRIAALHALSDVLVAGDTPIAAQALVTLQRARPEMQKSDLTLMLCGALEELAAHQTKLIGGHTTVAGEAMLGFAVTGQSQTKVDPPALVEDDNLLLLSKPIGIGVILAAEMRGTCPPEAYEAAINVMLASNAPATRLIMEAVPAALMTDVTGFGVARHALNLMQRAAFSGIELWPDKLPLITGVQPLAQNNIRSSLYSHNSKDIHLQGGAILGAEYSAIIDLLFDPQTSGGVLTALPRSVATKICSKMHKAGYKQAAIIGKLTRRHNGISLEKEANGK